MHLEVRRVNTRLFVGKQGLPDEELAESSRPLVDCDM